MYSGHSTAGYYPKANNKNDIIDALARDKQMLGEIKKICKTTAIDDLMQMIYIYLLEKSEDLIVRLNKEKQLKWFVIRLVMNQFYSKSSPYYKKHIRRLEYLDDTLSTDSDTQQADNAALANYSVEIEREVELNEDKEAEIIFMNKAIEELHWYDKEIFLMYELGDKSFTELQSELGISRNSLFTTCKRVREELNKKLKK